MYILASLQIQGTKSSCQIGKPSCPISLLAKIKEQTRKLVNKLKEQIRKKLPNKPMNKFNPMKE